MATPAKQARQGDHDCPVSGYIHNVTPIKMAAKSNTPYFNCLIQTDHSTFHDVVSFSPEKRTLLLQASAKKTPLRFKNVARQLSYTSPSKTSIKCLKHTEISETKVNFQVVEPSLQRKNVPELSLENIISSAVVGDYVSANAKIVSFDQDQKTVRTKTGKSLLLQNCTIGDASASLRLSLWDQHVNIPKLNKSYSFTHLSVKDFDGEKYLSTTSSSQITPCANIDSVQYNDTTCILSGSPCLVAVSVHTACDGCNTKLDVPESTLTTTSTYKCNICNMRQKIGSLKRSCNIVLRLENNETRFSIYHDVVKCFLESCNKLYLLTDADNLEEFFIESNIQLTLPSKNSKTPTAVKIASPTPVSTQTSTQTATNQISTLPPEFASLSKGQKPK